MFRAKLTFLRRRGFVTLAAEKLGRIMVDMLGADGRLDPSVKTLAARASVDPSTVTRSLARLRDLGFVTWVRRLVRGADSGWRVEQTSNAYALCLPSPAMCILPVKIPGRSSSLPSASKMLPREAGWRQQDEEARANAARQMPRSPPLMFRRLENRSSPV